MRSIFLVGRVLFTSLDLSAMAVSGPTTSSASTFHSCTEGRCNTTPRALRTDCIKEIFLNYQAFGMLVISRAWKPSLTPEHIR
jgi:hypothetical protein